LKFTICVVAIFSPVLSWAQLAGNWAGMMTGAQGAHRIVLQVSGPFTAMKASADIPEQKLYNAPVESITFLESTLDFSIPASDVRYSGVLNDNGAIVGTFTQHGVGVPLVLARVVGELPPTVAIPGGTVENGRYHDEITGVEFDLPSSWMVSRAEHEPGNPGGLTVFEDRSGNATVVAVNMVKAALSPQGVSRALELVIPHQIAMRDGQTGGGPLHTARDYTRTYFMVRGAAEDLPSLQASLDQALQSAKIP
jgi:hypothetical protein